MNYGNIIVEARNEYGKKSISINGDKYYFVRISEKVMWNANFLILIKSVKNESKMLVNIECDKDFIVKFN